MIQNSNYKNIINFIYIASLKFGGVIYTTYTLFFLYYFGGFEEVGIYSSMIAVISPAIMFSSLRHVENISLATNKRQALLLSVGGSCLLYITLSIPIYSLFLNKYYDNYLFLSLILIRPLEILSDFYNTYLISIGNKRKAGYTLFIRVTLMFTISILLVLIFTETSKIWIILISAYFSIFTSYFFIDNNYFFKYFKKINFIKIINHIKINIKFGFLNVFISINSNIPRYYITFLNNFEILGFYSILYQISATLVNICQHPISIYVMPVKKYLKLNVYLIRKIIFIFSIYFIIYIYFINKFSINTDLALYSFTDFLIIISILVSMFLFLLLRGILLTAIISLNCNNYIYYIFIPIILSLIFSGLANYFSLINNTIILSTCYVLLSSLLSTIFMYRLILDYK